MVSNIRGVPSNTVWFRGLLDQVLTTEPLLRRPRHALGLHAQAASDCAMVSVATTPWSIVGRSSGVGSAGTKNVARRTLPADPPIRYGGLTRPGSTWSGRRVGIATDPSTSVRTVSLAGPTAVGCALETSLDSRPFVVGARGLDLWPLPCQGRPAQRLDQRFRRLEPVQGVTGVPSSTAWSGRLLDQMLTTIGRQEMGAVASWSRSACQTDGGSHGRHDRSRDESVGQRPSRTDLSALLLGPTPV